MRWLLDSAKGNKWNNLRKYQDSTVVSILCIAGCCVSACLKSDPEFQGLKSTEDLKWSLHWNNWRIQDPRSRQEEKLSYIHSSLKNWGVLNIKKVAGLNWMKIWRSFSAFYTTLGRHLGLETAFSFHFCWRSWSEDKKSSACWFETMQGIAFSFHYWD